MEAKATLRLINGGPHARLLLTSLTIDVEHAFGADARYKVRGLHANATMEPLGVELLVDLSDLLEPDSGGAMVSNQPGVALERIVGAVFAPLVSGLEIVVDDALIRETERREEILRHAMGFVRPQDNDTESF